MTAADLLYWMADNLDIWRPVAIATLAAIAGGALYFAALGAGMVEFRTKGSGWRRNMPTPKQLDNVRHALAGLHMEAPDDHVRVSGPLEV